MTERIIGVLEAFWRRGREIEIINDSYLSNYTQHGRVQYDGP